MTGLQMVVRIRIEPQVDMHPVCKCSEVVASHPSYAMNDISIRTIINLSCSQRSCIQL
jgi:hypothetical protein